MLCCMQFITFCRCCIEMLSGGFGDVIQPLPAFSDLSSVSTAVAHTPVSSVSTSSPSTAQPPSTRRAAVTTGREPHPASNSLSTADAPHSGGISVSSTIDRDSQTASKAVMTAEVGSDRCQVDKSASFRRLDVPSTNVSSDQAGMVIDGRDAVSSRRGRWIQPSVNVSTSAGTAQSFPSGQNHSSSTSFVHQRPSSSNQHIRSTPHRSALAANTTSVTSTSVTVPDVTVPEPSSSSFLQSSKAAALPQVSTVVDNGKSVS